MVSGQQVCEDGWRSKGLQRVGEWLLLRQESVGIGTMSVLPSLHLMTCLRERLGELLLALPVSGVFCALPPHTVLSPAQFALGVMER